MPYNEKLIRGTLPGTFVPVEYHTDKNGKEIIDTLKEEIERRSQNKAKKYKMMDLFEKFLSVMIIIAWMVTLLQK
jgi:hypothetical protein